MIKELEKLFEEWHTSNCWRMSSQYKTRGKEVFVSDGFVKYDKYKEANRKILFITKEAHLGDAKNWDNYEDGEKIDLLEDVRKNDEIETPRIFWRRLAEWAYAVLNTTETKQADIREIIEGICGSNKDWQQVMDNKSDALSKVALINIKKAAGDTTTDQDKFAYFLESVKNKEEYKEKLAKEIKIINPDIIVCCGTFEIFRNEIIENKDSLVQKRNRLYELNENEICATVVDYFHPSSRINSDLAFYGIASIFQNGLNV